MDLFSVQFTLLDRYGYMPDVVNPKIVEICAIDFDGPGKFTSTKAIAMLCEFIKKYTGETLGKDLWIADIQLTEVGRPDTVEVNLKTVKRQNLIYKS